MSDGGITNKPQPPTPPAPETAITSGFNPFGLSKAGRPGMGEQIQVLLVQLALLAGIVLVMAFVNFPYMSRLWTHPMGIKISLTALFVWAAGVAIYLVGCALVNRFLTGEEQSSLRKTLFTVLLGVEVFFYLPALFLILVGPGAIQIYEGLVN